MNKLLSFLSSIKPLSPELEEHLASILKVRVLKKKEVLLEIGKVCRQISFVESGLLRCYYLNKSKKICSWFMQEGDVIASVGSFYSQQAGYECIQALEACRIWSITYEQLQEIYDLYPQFNLHGRVLTEKYYQLWDKAIYMLKMDRLKERYKYLKEHLGKWEERVPRGDLASYLGVNLEALSRLGRG